MIIASSNEPRSQNQVQIIPAVTPKKLGDEVLDSALAIPTAFSRRTIAQCSMKKAPVTISCQLHVPPNLAGYIWITAEMKNTATTQRKRGRPLKSKWVLVNQWCKLTYRFTSGLKTPRRKKSWTHRFHLRDQNSDSDCAFQGSFYHYLWKKMTDNQEYIYLYIIFFFNKWLVDKLQHKKIYQWYKYSINHEWDHLITKKLGNTSSAGRNCI